MVQNFIHNMKRYSCQLIALACILLNQAYMHLVVLDGESIKTIWIYRSVTFAVFDVLVVLLVCGILTLFRNRRAAYTMTWLFWLVIVLSNIGYSRYFHQYLSIGALAEIRNLGGMWWMEFVMPAVRSEDIILLFTTVVFFLSLYKPEILRASKGMNTWKGRMDYKKVVLLLFIVVLPHTVLSDLYNIYQRDFPRTVTAYLSKVQGDRFHTEAVLEQKLFYCSYGMLRTQLFFTAFYPNVNKELTDGEKKEIVAFLKERDDSIGKLYNNSFRLPKDCNISLIIVESMLSELAEKRVNGREVTPAINSLRRYPGAYCNDNVTKDVALGESSDAQVLYFTGLLPEKNNITVSGLANKKIIGLPDMLKRQRGCSTMMTIPTKKFFWHQEEVNLVYGIDSLCSALEDDNAFMCEDDVVFDKAINMEHNAKQPFLHVILTASMHSPYDRRKEVTNGCPLVFPKDYPLEYCNYLRSCWFTDRQIGRYIESLKDRKLWDKTVLVILSDHDAHPSLLKMPEDKLKQCKLPFYIINANIDLPDENRKISQLDIYPSLMDMFELRHEWTGLGNSIFRKERNMTKEYIERRANVSELILTGNWFALK